jgi:hypothetical protein
MHEASLTRMNVDFGLITFVSRRSWIHKKTISFSETATSIVVQIGSIMIAVPNTLLEVILRPSFLVMAMREGFGPLVVLWCWWKADAAVAIAEMQSNSFNDGMVACYCCTTCSFKMDRNKNK